MRWNPYNYYSQEQILVHPNLTKAVRARLEQIGMRDVETWHPPTALEFLENGSVLLFNDLVPFEDTGKPEGLFLEPDMTVEDFLNDWIY